MKNRSVIILSLLVLLFAASQIYLGMRILEYRTSLESLSSGFDAYCGRVDMRFKDLEKEIQLLSDIQKTSIDGIHERLDMLSDKSDAQISMTAGIKSTYDRLYEEQRKKTLDTTSQDTAIALIKREADRLYSEKNYAAAYKEFTKVLSYQNDDMESRLKKMKSLYYRNRADSSKYSEILEDIRILKTNGRMDNEAEEIEKIINVESEGLNE